VSSLSVRIPASVRSTPEVSVVYLYLLRFGYLLLSLVLGSSIWPAVLQHVPWPLSLSSWTGIADSQLAALSLLSVLGLRYPLKMLPLLIFEITWKSIWLLAVALPLWASHAPIGDDIAQTIQACLMAVIFPFLIPWRYVFSTFALQAGDRWR
jgi:hypothetical protein